MKTDKYFATLPSLELAADVEKKCEDYYQFLISSNQLSLWRKAYDFYYEPMRGQGGLLRGGQQGELTKICVNQYRNLLKHLQTMTTSQRPNYEPRAVNTDHESQAQTILARGLLDYYLKEKKLERYIKKAVEHALLWGEGFIVATWDVTGGEIYDTHPETGAAIFEGDIKYQNVTPMDMVRDYTKIDAMSDNWKVVITYENKYDLAAQNPELADKIINLPSKLDEYWRTRILPSAFTECDDVIVRTLYHKPTDALPQGRMQISLSSEIVLFDGPIPYQNLPIHRIAASELVGTCFGYTVGYDLMPLQETTNILHSSVTTNQSTFGVQNIVTPKGGGVSVTNVSGGLNFIEIDQKQGEIYPLNLTQTPKEIFDYIQMVESVMQTLSGVNSVARGNPEASLKSGSALALVQSQAIQFNMDLQQSYAQLVEDLGTATIQMLKDFAQVPRVAAIVGKSDRSYMRSFKGDDLTLVNRVSVDLGNPLTRTTAGKVNLAEALLEKGLIKSPEQYVQIITTGRIEPLIEGPQAENMLIKSENERLGDGVAVQALITDDHSLHVAEHKVVIASPEARENPAVVQATLNHIQEHINLAMTRPPAMSELLRMQPLMSLAPPPMPQGQQGDAPEGLNPQDPTIQEAQDVQQPNMPTNPLSGEEWNPQDGGLPNLS